ncbi:CD1375 family protein [Vagococcus fluvialis]|uniref:CD1375 family protein n=1 Tax=Vagococcus fluvialis TaxID=2738 RepID=UPI001D0A6A20|nr:CD1375 family protein [Vagococcus fluvialis]UDM72794.1 hypothetical protein K5L00_14335 [Vagococcus fluvialis]UDM78476.1 hypothetical protein K5K98_14540 [Vagococcus fluvialis]UDM84064.1 hypothetical protein K5K96_14360 [Vagococcus fluvialis]
MDKRGNMERFPNLIMMYADHVMRGTRSIDGVPEKIREDVSFVVEEATKKQA